MPLYVFFFTSITFHMHISMKIHKLGFIYIRLIHRRTKYFLSKKKHCLIFVFNNSCTKGQGSTVRNREACKDTVYFWMSVKVLVCLYVCVCVWIIQWAGGGSDAGSWWYMCQLIAGRRDRQAVCVSVAIEIMEKWQAFLYAKILSDTFALTYGHPLLCSGDKCLYYSLHSVIPGRFSYDSSS